MGDRLENTGEIVAAKFSPDGRYILAVSGKTAYASGYLFLWRVAEFLSEEKSDRYASIFAAINSPITQKPNP